MIKYVLGLLLIASASLAQTRDVTIGWTDTNQGVAYIVYWGVKPNVYTNQIVTNNKFATIRKLPVKRTYYVAVSAFTTLPWEVKSEEIAFYLPPRKR